MRKELIREPSGDVVLRSNTNAIRFQRLWGMTPNQWFPEPFPMATNDFPGSGVSVQWDTGQDPTQASANGLLPNPVPSRYMSESIFDPVNCIFKVGGYPPQFWLSSEKADDAIAPNPDATDTGWRTLYQPGVYTPWLIWKERPVIFEGRSACWSGLFFVGDELNADPLWNRRLCGYGNGRQACKLNIGMQHGDATSFAGIMFRKSVRSDANTDKHHAYAAPGIHFLVWRTGAWSVVKMTNGAEVVLKSGKLSKAQIKTLQTEIGLEFEIQSFATYCNIYAGGGLIASADLSGCNEGPHLCLFASTHSGWIMFSNRQMFDLGIRFDSQYQSLGDGRFVSDIAIYKTYPEARFLYRAGMPGVFMNQQTFKGNDRRTLGFNAETRNWSDIDGVYNLWDYDEYFAGNTPCSCGIKMKVLECKLDGVKSEKAHLLISKHQINDEFVIGVNPLPPESKTYFQRLDMKIEWDTVI